MQKNKDPPIQIYGNVIENVENFTYLGSNIRVSIDSGAAKLIRGFKRQEVLC
jgi:hypothetical protein